MGVLGPPATVEDSRLLGRAAVMAMLAVARASPGGVLDSTFYPYTVSHLEQLTGTLIEVRAGARARSRRRGMRPAAPGATRGTSTPSALPRSCGTSITWRRSASAG